MNVMRHASCVVIAILAWRGEAIPIDPVAKIEQTYQNTQTLQAEFVQSTFVRLTEKTLTRPGRIFYQRGGKLRIEYSGDKMTHYITDGKTLWIKNPRSGDVEEYEIKNSGLPEEALKFLTELGNLRTYFKVSMAKPTGGEVTFDLRPRKKTTYSHLLCNFDEKNYLKDLTIFSLSGNKSDYKFFNRKTGGTFPKKLFLP